MTGVDLHTHSVESDGTNTVAENVALAIERGLWAGHPRPPVTADPLMLRMELSVGDATCALKPAEIREIFAELASANQQNLSG